MTVITANFAGNIRGAGVCKQFHTWMCSLNQEYRERASALRLRKIFSSASVQYRFLDPDHCLRFTGGKFLFLAYYKTQLIFLFSHKAVCIAVVICYGLQLCSRDGFHF